MFGENGSKQLPFILEGTLPSGEGEAELEVVLYCNGDQGALSGSVDCLELFAMAVNEQMFPFGDGYPAESFMVLLNTKTEEHGQRLKYRYRIKSVPPFAFLILLSLLVQMYYCDEPIVRVHLITSETLHQTITAKELLKAERNVPKQIRNIPFRIDYDDNAFAHKTRIVHFEFVSVVSSELFEHLGRALNVWDHLVLLGGFQLDFVELDGFPPTPGQTNLISSRVVEHSFDNFDAFESSFNAIINLAAHFHAKGHYINLLEIG